MSLSTKIAYTKLLNSGKAIRVADQLGIKYSTFRCHKTEVNQGKFPTIETMEERLIKAGYVVLQEKEWVAPKVTGEKK